MMGSYLGYNFEDYDELILRLLCAYPTEHANGESRTLVHQTGMYLY